MINNSVKHIDTLIFALTGYFAVYLFTKYSGVGISPDSVMYASTAESIATHGTLTTFNGNPLMFFPVGYPAFLSVCYFLGTNAFTAGPVINGLLFAVLIAACGWLLARWHCPLLYKWFVLLAVLLSPALLEIYTYLWSETLFIVLIIAFTAAMQQYLIRQTAAALYWAALFAAFACITRYAGITLAGAGCLLIMLDATQPAIKRFKNTLLFGSLSVSLLIINLLINYFNTGYSTGTREPSLTGFAENLYYFGTVLCGWLGLGNSAYPYGQALVIIILIGLTSQLALAAAKKQRGSFVTVCIAFALVYSVFILLIATFSRFERLNSRLLSPVYAPMLIGCTAWLPQWLAKATIKKQFAVAALPVIASGWLLFSLLKIDMQRYDDEFDYGVPGYSDDDWNKSAFIQLLKAHPDIYKPGVPVYSNADDAVYFFTGMHATLLPHRAAKEDVCQLSVTNHYYLIWFDAFDQDELIGLDELKSKGHLKQLRSFEGGAVYEFSK